MSQITIGLLSTSQNEMVCYTKSDTIIKNWKINYL